MPRKKSKTPKSTPPPPPKGTMGKQLSEYRKKLKKFGGRK